VAALLQQVQGLPGPFQFLQVPAVFGWCRQPGLQGMPFPVAEIFRPAADEPVQGGFAGIGGGRGGHVRGWAQQCRPTL